MKNRRFWILAFSALLVFPFLVVDSFSAENDGLVISLNKESYAPGETIIVTGSAIAAHGGPVSLLIVSPAGNIIAIAQVTPDSENNFSQDFVTSIGGVWKETGMYIIKATDYYGNTELQFEYGRMMSADVKSSTETPSGSGSESQMGLGQIDQFSDTTNVFTLDGYDIFYKISGAKILKIIPDIDNTSLIIEIETSSDGELTITLPREVIDTNEGSFFVLVDDEETYYDYTSTSDSWTLTIPFYNGSETIEIIGTFVIPEFGTIAAIILAVAITSIIVLSAKTKLSIMPKI